MDKNVCINGTWRCSRRFLSCISGIAVHYVSATCLFFRLLLTFLVSPSWWTSHCLQLWGVRRPCNGVLSHNCMCRSGLHQKVRTFSILLGTASSSLCTFLPSGRTPDVFRPFTHIANLIHEGFYFVFLRYGARGAFIETFSWPFWFPCLWIVCSYPLFIFQLGYLSSP